MFPSKCLSIKKGYDWVVVVLRWIDTLMYLKRAFLDRVPVPVVLRSLRQTLALARGFVQLACSGRPHKAWGIVEVASIVSWTRHVVSHTSFSGIIPTVFTRGMDLASRSVSWRMPVVVTVAVSARVNSKLPSDDNHRAARSWECLMTRMVIYKRTHKR